MSCFTIIIANDVGFIFSRRGLLNNVDVYSANVRAIRGIAIVSLLFIVKLVGLVRTILTLTLLLTRILPIVDLDCYSDIVVKRVRPIDFI